MLAFTLRRILVALAVALTVSVASFMLLHLSGDLATAIAGPEATGPQIVQIRKDYGLDQPLLAQFLAWGWRALHLDFGNSFYFRERVIDLLAARLPITLYLGVIALGVALFVAVPLGVIAAVKRDTWIDRLALFVSVLGQAMPSFWFGLTLILIFSVNLRWLPVSGNASWKNFVLPAVALGYYAMPAVMRLTRNGMLEVLASDYVRTARAKGLPPRTILVRTGIGGVFLRAHDPKALTDWYHQHLGFPVTAYGTSFLWKDEVPAGTGMTAWSAFPDNTDYFGKGSHQAVMINYRVDDLDALLLKLEAAGVTIDPKRENASYGKFAWITDPEGNRVELWQPMPKGDKG